MIDRRNLMRGAGFGGARLAQSAWMPTWAQGVSAGTSAPLPAVTAEDINLRIAHEMITYDGR